MVKRIAFCLIAAVMAAVALHHPAAWSADGRPPLPSTATTAPNTALPATAAPGTGANARQTPDYESTPFSFDNGRTPPLRQGERRAVIPSMFTVLLYVAVICAFFVLVIWLIKKYVPGHRQLFSHPALEILGRTPIDQRRFVSLVRVGRRILVIGVTPDAINSLSEIDDGAEVAEILDLARPKNEAGKSLFVKLFQKHMMETDQALAESDIDHEAQALADDISALRDKIKSRRDATENQVGEGLDRIG